jgi:Ca-activated chloride channel family protein
MFAGEGQLGASEPSARTGGPAGVSVKKNTSSRHLISPGVATVQLLTVDVTPLRPAVRTDAPVTQDVLLRITPAVPDGVAQRPPLNLGLVLDRSGSMAGSGKMDFARQAACYAIEQLLPDDRVSVTVFDDHVDSLIPSTTASEKTRLLAAVRRVEPRGSTALHAGWLAGANQVREFRVAAGLNRVLLLTDGLANVGETNPEAITAHVKHFAAAGVGTTAMGVGRDYNENLLEAMARAGDGNYYFIESPRQLADIFQTELQGLMATAGDTVRLAIEPLNGAAVVDVLNDLGRDGEGRLLLPNFVVGMPVEVVLRLAVPPQAGEADLCRFVISWRDPRQGVQNVVVTLRQPAVAGDEWQALAGASVVQERAALQEIGRLKRRATEHLDRRDADGAMGVLRECRRVLDGLERTADVSQEERDLAGLEQRVEQGDLVTTSKEAKFQHYNRTFTRRRPD